MRYVEQKLTCCEGMSFGLHMTSRGSTHNRVVQNVKVLTSTAHFRIRMQSKTIQERVFCTQNRELILMHGASPFQSILSSRFSMFRNLAMIKEKITQENTFPCVSVFGIHPISTFLFPASSHSTSCCEALMAAI
jgi:hypothetical protein